MRVTPHDIRAVCEACNTTLRDLAEYTHLTEEELLSFAAGHTALSASDRLNIIAGLFKNGALHEVHVPQPPPEVMQWLILGVGHNAMAQAAYHTLVEEVEEERASQTTHSSQTTH